MGAPKPVIRKGWCVLRYCDHCEAKTMQVVAGQSAVCLQCVADGGTCCSLSRFNRWRSASAEKNWGHSGFAPYRPGSGSQ